MLMHLLRLCFAAHSNGFDDFFLNTSQDLSTVHDLTQLNAGSPYPLCSHAISVQRMWIDNKIEVHIKQLLAFNYIIDLVLSLQKIKMKITSF